MIDPGTRRVGFVGLGAMGLPMARNLARAGHALTLFDADPDRLAAAAAETGGTAAADLADLAADVEAVILMLPDGRTVRRVLIEDGLAEALSDGVLAIDMSSSDPQGTRALGAELSARGLRFMDAPVSGGVKRAADGSLAIMMGGEPATMDAARPILSTMGSALFETGPLGCGHAMKALNNYCSAAGLVAAVEAVRVGRAFGLDPERMVDVLNASTGRNNATENKMKQHVLSGTYGSGFGFDLMRKDLATAMALADSLGMETPVGHAVLELWTRAREALGPGADHTAIAKYLDALDAPR